MSLKNNDNYAFTNKTGLRLCHIFVSKAIFNWTWCIFQSVIIEWNYEYGIIVSRKLNRRASHSYSTWQDHWFGWQHWISKEIYWLIQMSNCIMVLRRKVDCISGLLHQVVLITDSISLYEICFQSLNPLSIGGIFSFIDWELNGKIVKNNHKLICKHSGIHLYT